MDYQARGSPFKNQFIVPQTPAPNISTHLSSTALQALPYISLLIGIDAIEPTKAVYALYDPSRACLRFVHGDGKFISAERVCFRNSFKDGVPNLNRRQRLHFFELISRSVDYYRLINEDEVFKARVKKDFPTESSVKATLTFMSDLKLTPDSPPALQPLPVGGAPRTLEQFYDQAMPCIPLTDGPTWGFSPRDFQAFATQEMEVEFTNLYREYCSKYGSKILPIDFQHALFCLAGLMKADLIPFVFVGQNDPKFFHQGVTPPLPPKLLIPRRTASDWTVDCFVARFAKFEKMFNGGFERWPNPIAWLEAEMNYEESRGRAVRPWKLIFEKGEKQAKEPPVIVWEKLQSLKWQTRGSYSQYPKPLIPKNAQPLELHDIISKKSFRFKESKRAKKDRKEKEKAARRTATIDLTGNDAASGHMNQPAVRRAWDRDYPSDDVGSGYTGDESELASPIDRKRKYGAGNSPDLGRYVDSDEEEFLTLEQMQHSHRVKQEVKPRFIPEIDLYDVSDQEPERREPSQRKKARHQSPPKQFKNPLNVDMLFGLESAHDESSKLPVRSGSKAASFKTPSPELAQKFGNRGGFVNRTYNTSSPESDLDEVEIIETQTRPRLSLPRSQSKSPTKPSTPTSSQKYPKTTIHDRCDAFEQQHRIKNSDFDQMVYHRLHSPSSSSPEAQQTLYPTIERSSSFEGDGLSIGGKSVSPKSRVVIELESPELEGGDEELNSAAGWTESY